MYKCLSYLKIDGCFYDKGDSVDLSALSDKEIARLERKGIVERLGDAAITKVSNGEGDDGKIGGNDESKGNGDGDMTEKEVREELSVKITHAVAVKELTLLGAEFKKNASLETLIDVIMENEEYEGYFFDYIDTHGL